MTKYLSTSEWLITCALLWCHRLQLFGVLWFSFVWSHKIFWRLTDVTTRYFPAVTFLRSIYLTISQIKFDRQFPNFGFNIAKNTHWCKIMINTVIMFGDPGMSLTSCGQIANAYDFSCDFFVRQEDYIPLIFMDLS